MKRSKLDIIILIMCGIVLSGLYVALIVMNDNLRSQVINQTCTIDQLIEKQSSYEQLLDSIDNLNSRQIDLQNELRLQKELLNMAEKQYHFHIIKNSKGSCTTYTFVDNEQSPAY